MRRLVDFASGQLNVPYKWGGSTPKGFDCSGFTTYCFRHFGVQLPRTAADQAQSGKRIRSKKAKAGDLIFFKGPDHKQKKTAHVGIVVSGKRKQIRFIHAGSKGVTISGLGEEYFSKRFTTIRRVRG
ncbi:MAG TPA: C40 family peptidase [Chitinophagaceae bacterium]|nr:C40 family peptidase [Chitinophagaceae bacterium]